MTNAVLITGVTRGIGRGIALHLAREGHDIAGCYLTDEEAATSLAAEIKAEGVQVHLGRCDVADAEAVAEFVHEAEQAVGPITGLVCNAGITRDRPLIMLSPEDWDRVIATNLTGTANLCRVVGFGMVKRKAGAIVTVSSIAGIDGNIGQTNYAASKAGVIALTRSLAKELGGRGIRVNAVAPGFIETEMTEALTGSRRDQAREAVPLRRFGQPEDVAPMVSFLLSEKAGYITGQVIRIDGGMAL